MRVHKANKAERSSAFFSWAFQGLFTSVFLSLFAVFVVTMYVFFTDKILDDATLKIIFTASMLTSIFFGSLYASFKAGKNGLVLGIFIGALYAGIALFLHHFVNVDIDSDLISVTKVFICVGAGLLGGVIGVNL